MAGKDDNRTANQWKDFSKLGVKKGTFTRTARKLETASIKHAHRFITRRWSNIRNVSRHMVGWLVLVALLVGLTWLQTNWFQDGYLTQGPQSGGVYAEGMVGRVETLNPLYVSSVSERTVDKLVFSSLLAYDRDNALRSDVAKSWSVGEDGKTYTIDLRDDVFWHDGQKLTVDDVVFTIKLMQSPTVKSQLYKNWAGVSVEKTSDKQLRITTPAVYAPFAHALTFSILPKHLLEKIEPSKLREDSFSRIPVGSGPFKFQRIQVINPATDRLVVHMGNNPQYHGGIVRLNRFQVHTFQSSALLKKGLLTGEVGAAYRLDSEDARAIREANSFIKNTHIKINNGVFAIFNTANPNLSDATVRQAVTEATNRKSIIQNAVHGSAGPLEGPVLSQSVQSQLAFDAHSAATRLDQAGWMTGADGIRQKDGNKLELIVVAPNSGDYPAILAQLTKQWKQVGIGVSPKLVMRDKLFSEFVQPRAYDVFLNELSIGADPDVYPYWHSSQAKADGLNFANYQSPAVDDILSSARTRLDASLRASKYQAFAEQWAKDAPAVALYQPEANYLTIPSVWTGEDSSVLADSSVRLRYVYEWTAQTTQVYRTP